MPCSFQAVLPFAIIPTRISRKSTNASWRLKFKLQLPWQRVEKLNNSSLQLKPTESLSGNQALIQALCNLISSTRTVLPMQGSGRPELAAASFQMPILGSKFPSINTWVLPDGCSNLNEKTCGQYYAFSNSSNICRLVGCDMHLNAQNGTRTTCHVWRIVRNLCKS